MTRQYPGEPVESCPDLDDAISALERARSIAVDLRIWGREQYDKADSLEEELSDAARRIEALEEELQEVSNALLKAT